MYILPTVYKLDIGEYEERKPKKNQVNHNEN
jgi:hypothetical protein